MNSLRPWQDDSALEQRIQQALARHLQDMRVAGIVAKAGIDELGSVHRYAADKFTATVATAHHLVEAVQAARELSPQSRTALTQLTQTYLQEMLLATDETAAAIVDILLDL